MAGRVVKLGWKCHTPNLLAEITNNVGAQVLRIPLAIMGELLHAVATRAAEINDPKLNLLMLRLTLYDAADPEKHTAEAIEDTFRAVERAALEGETK